MADDGPWTQCSCCSRWRSSSWMSGNACWLPPDETENLLKLFKHKKSWGRQVPVKMGEITNVMEYQAIAKQKLPKMMYDYYESGAEDKWMLQEIREAFSRILEGLMSYKQLI